MVQKKCGSCKNPAKWNRGMILPATFANSSKEGIHIKGFYYCDTCKKPV